MPIPYPSHGGFLYATGSSYSPSRYLSYEHPIEISRNPLWECSYCKQTNSIESLECTKCGAGQLRSVRSRFQEDERIYQNILDAFVGDKNE